MRRIYQKAFRLPWMAVACVFFLAAFLVLAETNEIERAMVTDSDGDGMTDWEEWQAGTNPGDPSNCFVISTCKIENGKVILDWKAVSTTIYEVVTSSNIQGLASNPQHVQFITSTGGTPPWFSTSTTATNTIDGSNLFFRIRIIAPQYFEQSPLDMATFE